MHGNGDFISKPTKRDINDAEKILDYKHDVKKINKAHLKHLEEQKHEFKERLMGLRYRIEDWKAKYIKAKNNMHEIEASLLKLKMKLQHQVIICISFKVQVFHQLTLFPQWFSFILLQINLYIEFLHMNFIWL
jgi:hypothetical protein